MADIAKALRLGVEARCLAEAGKRSNRLRKPHSLRLCTLICLTRGVEEEERLRFRLGCNI